MYLCLVLQEKDSLAEYLCKQISSIISVAADDQRYPHVTHRISVPAGNLCPFGMAARSQIGQPRGSHMPLDTIIL